MRSYDLRSGKVIYEFMPKEMLPNIQKPQKPVTLMEQEKDKDKDNNLISTKKLVKTYGLDGKVIIYHEPANSEDNKSNDDFIRPNDKAYAFVAAGRGGAYIYAFDISKKDEFNLLWTKTSKELPNFWAAKSEPVVGRVNIKLYVYSIKHKNLPYFS